MASFPSLLSPLQRRILEKVGRNLPGFFLTGGSALGPFYLGHRRSADLDFFTRQGADYDERVRQFLRLVVAEDLAATPGNAGPGFRRFVLSDRKEEVPVDLVHDTAPAVGAPATSEEGFPLDSLDDITANKLTTILSRAEIRDYVDLFFLAKERDLLAFVPLARQKDGGVDEATLAFVLSQVKVNRAPEGLEIPVSAAEIQSFFKHAPWTLLRSQGSVSLHLSAPPLSEMLPKCLEVFRAKSASRKASRSRPRRTDWPASSLIVGGVFSPPILQGGDLYDVAGASGYDGRTITVFLRWHMGDHTVRRPHTAPPSILLQTEDPHLDCGEREHGVAVIVGVSVNPRFSPERQPAAQEPAMACGQRASTAGASLYFPFGQSQPRGCTREEACRAGGGIL